ncbi:MAG: NifU family protein [Bacteroidia bacterium]|nr:NifU family protein [Bacteroidia bacterium]
MSRTAILHIEGVPNPNAMKFVLENGILSEEPYEFRSYADAADSPLARKLLMLRYIDRILLNQNAVTIVKKEGQGPSWKEIALELKLMVQQHLEADEPILFVGASQLTHPRSDETIASIVTQVLDKHIRPAAQEDGGDILFESYQDGVLNLSMHGACHRCPYAMQTMKDGVEKVMMSMLPEVKKVTALENGVS